MAPSPWALRPTTGRAAWAEPHGRAAAAADRRPPLDLLARLDLDPLQRRPHHLDHPAAQIARVHAGVDHGAEPDARRRAGGVRLLRPAAHQAPAPQALAQEGGADVEGRPERAARRAHAGAAVGAAARAADRRRLRPADVERPKRRHPAQRRRHAGGAAARHRRRARPHPPRVLHLRARRNRQPPAARAGRQGAPGREGAPAGRCHRLAQAAVAPAPRAAE